MILILFQLLLSVASLAYTQAADHLLQCCVSYTTLSFIGGMEQEVVKQNDVVVHFILILLICT